MEGGEEMASVIRLEEAYFCLNCEVLTNYSEMCPVCGQRQLWPLENWIGKINARENAGDKECNLKNVNEMPVV